MAYRQDGGYVLNDDGKIAVQYVITENPKRVILESTGGDYYFAPQHHVNLAWVSPQDVPALLAVREKGCNCNNTAIKQAFILASLANVNIFTTGSQ